MYSVDRKATTPIPLGSKVSDIETYGGIGKESNCVLPFNFKNKTYSDCISDPCNPWDENCDGSQTWCSRTGNMDRDQEWGFCKPKGKMISDLNRKYRI